MDHAAHDTRFTDEEQQRITDRVVLARGSFRLKLVVLIEEGCGTRQIRDFFLEEGLESIEIDDFLQEMGVTLPQRPKDYTGVTDERRKELQQLSTRP